MGDSTTEYEIGRSEKGTVVVKVGTTRFQDDGNGNLEIPAGGINGYYNKEEVDGRIEEAISSFDYKFDDYYKKEETMSTSQIQNEISSAEENAINISKDYTNNAISGVTSFETEIVSELPATGAKGTIYLVQNDSSDGYDEYLYIDNAWEVIGSTNINLEDYYTKSETNIILGEYATQLDLQQLETSISSVEDSISSLENSVSSLENSVSHVESAVNALNNQVGILNTQAVKISGDQVINDTKTLNYRLILNNPSTGIINSTTKLSTYTEQGRFVWNITDKVAHHAMVPEWTLDVADSSRFIQRHLVAGANNEIASAAPDSQQFSNAIFSDESHIEGSNILTNGWGHSIYATNNVVFGADNIMSGQNNLETGYDNDLQSGNFNIIGGDGNRIYKTHRSIISGHGNTVGNELILDAQIYSDAIFSDNSHIRGGNVLCSGWDNTVNHTNFAALGAGLNSFDCIGGLAIGKYNFPNDASYFQIGDGADASNGHNAYSFEEGGIWFGRVNMFMDNAGIQKLNSLFSGQYASGIGGSVEINPGKQLSFKLTEYTANPTIIGCDILTLRDPSSSEGVLTASHSSLSLYNLDETVSMEPDKIRLITGGNSAYRGYQNLITPFGQNISYPEKQINTNMPISNLDSSNEPVTDYYYSDASDPNNPINVRIEVPHNRSGDFTMATKEDIKYLHNGVYQFRDNTLLDQCDLLVSAEYTFVSPNNVQDFTLSSFLERLCDYSNGILYKSAFFPGSSLNGVNISINAIYQGKPVQVIFGKSGTNYQIYVLDDNSRYTYNASVGDWTLDTTTATVITIDTEQDPEQYQNYYENIKSLVSL